jgi:hypothetical protein
LRQSRSVETLQHNAEAPIQGHFVEDLRSTHGKCSTGHLRFMLPEAWRGSNLEQLHDLTGRPDMNVRRGSFADLLPQESLHRLFLPLREQTLAAGKENPSRRGRRTQ